jgi:integrase
MIGTALFENNFPNCAQYECCLASRIYVTQVIRPTLEAEKIPWYGWHAFRRGLATNLHRLGVSDTVIQQILRHANVTTTINIYAKMVTQDADEAMKKLETRCSQLFHASAFSRIYRLVSHLDCLAVRGGSTFS